MAKYPAKISGGSIVANLDGEHYNITSPFSAKDQVKALPGAKWHSTAKVWQVKKRWHRKIAEMIGEAEVVESGAEDMAAQVVDAAGVDVSDYPWITQYHSYFALKFPYSEDAVKIIKDAGGEWDKSAKFWSFPIARKSQMLAAMLLAAEPIRQAIAAAKEEQAERQREKDARAQQRAQERADREQARIETRATRVLCHNGYAPAVGAVIKVRGEWRQVEGHGKWFLADEDLSSMGGPAGIEGERVRYAYTVAASDEQIAEAEAKEADQKAAAERSAARRAAVQTVAAGEVAPDTGEEPVGETIWQDDKSAAVGYRTWIVAGDDGYLYHLTYDGSDGAAWGTYNAGYNTRATRTLTTDELIEAIKQ